MVLLQLCQRPARAHHALALLQVQRRDGDGLALLVDFRMVLAGQRLARGEPLKQVALALGYSSATALSRVFAAHHGVAPRAWRQNAGGF